jgi:hypothetical protein
MPRSARPWFRFYVEAAFDPKLRRLTPTERWVFVACCCGAAKESLRGRLAFGEQQPYSIADIAQLADVRVDKVAAALNKMRALDMVDQDERGWFVVHWEDRQYESDSATERTRRWRERSRDVPTSDVVTGNSVSGAVASGFERLLPGSKPESERHKKVEPPAARTTATAAASTTGRLPDWHPDPRAPDRDDETNRVGIDAARDALQQARNDALGEQPQPSGLIWRTRKDLE